MESKVGVSNDNFYDECLYSPDPSPAEREDFDKNEGKGEVEDEEGGDEGDEDEGQEGEVEMEEGKDESTMAFKRVMKDYVEGIASEVEIYQQFEQIECESLARKKRKCIELVADQGHGSVKKLRLEDNIGATREEIEEVMNLGDRRSRRKLKKRGRRKGSRNNLSPEITKKLGEAILDYARGSYEDSTNIIGKI